MAASCLVSAEKANNLTLPMTAFNYHTYNILKKEEQAADATRKKKSLILKTRSTSSLSATSGSSKEKKSKYIKNNSSALLNYKPGLGGNSSKSYYFQVQTKPKPAQVSGNNGSNTGSFFMGGFLTRPKVKTGMSKLEKDLNNAISSLQHIRAEVQVIKQGGTKIGIQELKTGDKKSTKVTLTGGHSIKTGGRHVSPANSRLRTDSRGKSIDMKKKQLTASKSTSNIFVKPENIGSFGQNVKSYGIVKNLLGQLVPNLTSQKSQILPLDEFVQSLMPEKQKSQVNHNTSMGDLPTESSIKDLHAKYSEMVESIILASAEFKQRPINSLPATAESGTQTSNPKDKDMKTITFSNINLSKTMEELIKKVIIESKSVKYNPNTLTQYFETLVLSDRGKSRSISDMQKQALFVSIYSLLQRQMLVEVTLEMIKDSGVNVQNLFQYTFSRMGLDYERYVHYENNRDQDLSARSVFDGELDCSLNDEELSDRDMILKGYGNLGKFNYFPLDFTKIQQTQTHEDKTENHREHLQSTKR